MLKNRKVIGRILSEEEFSNLQFGWNKITDILPPNKVSVLMSVLVFQTKRAEKSIDELSKK